ncbi:DUF6734 family protein [Aquimarina algiphila]|uniref:DUF6734 family protein n=1 Tax=Aquimarina algiphila TaxID=2047982 RepID=UPI002492CDF8|nr:DUF6734 family protein [Aquimarina algiphila]
MKIVQSFWSTPFYKNANLSSKDRAKGGFISEKIFFMSCALSCLKLNEFYDEIELVTDDKGYNLLIEEFGLPYTTSKLNLNSLSEYSPDLWAFGKIIAYSLQDRPFIHVDNDVFIWKAFDTKVVEGNLIAQNSENNTEIYKEIIEIVNNNFIYIPSVMEKYMNDDGIIDNINAYNAGIFGGNNTDFFKEYCAKAIKIVDANKHLIKKVGISNFNIFFEQCLFYCMASNQNINVTPLLDDVSANFQEVLEFDGIPYKSFIHTVASSKKGISTNEQIYFRLKFEYPEYFERINNYFSELN